MQTRRASPAPSPAFETWCGIDPSRADERGETAWGGRKAWEMANVVVMGKKMVNSDMKEGSKGEYLQAILLACISAFEVRLRLACERHQAFRGKWYNRGKNFPMLREASPIWKSPTQPRHVQFPRHYAA
jgi:hypothetical protein